MKAAARNYYNEHLNDVIDHDVQATRLEVIMADWRDYERQFDEGYTKEQEINMAWDDHEYDGCTCCPCCGCTCTLEDRAMLDINMAWILIEEGG